MDHGWDPNGETGNWGPWGGAEYVCGYGGGNGPLVGGAENGGACCARPGKEPADRLPPKGRIPGADDTDDGGGGPLTGRGIPPGEENRGLPCILPEGGPLLNGLGAPLNGGGPGGTWPVVIGADWKGLGRTPGGTLAEEAKGPGGGCALPVEVKGPWNGGLTPKGGVGPLGLFGTALGGPNAPCGGPPGPLGTAPGGGGPGRDPGVPCCANGGGNGGLLLLLLTWKLIFYDAKAKSPKTVFPHWNVTICI